ncbi:MAG: enoyl-CoA hydratase-related protein [Burkholderiales bacterium]
MSEIRVETSAKIVTVTLDAPPVNSITVARYLKLAETFDEIGRRDDVHCAVLAAAGTRAFCAGLDLHEFASWPAERDHERAAAARRTFAAIRRCAIPVIAAVNGPALGAGCVIAACCDIRIASARATFGLPEINVGRCGGGAHVGRLVPQGMLRKMFFTGRPISAQEAYRVGFVEEIVPAERLLGAAQELAALIAEKSPLGLRLGKQALNEAEVMPVEEGYAAEQAYSAKLLQTEDAREAARSAIEKRAPVFKGR